MLRDLGVEAVVVDVFDAKGLRNAIIKAKPDMVIHQLTDLPHALDPAQMSEALVRNARLREVGTHNLVRASVAAGITRMVAQSIAFAYAPGPIPHTEDAPLNLDDPLSAITARAIASLEDQVLNASFTGIVLRYGKLYGPGTGFTKPAGQVSLHVDAAADAARRALTHGQAGVYNIADQDDIVNIDKAIDILDWLPGFRWTPL